jgi:aryl-alcohol dehydrogenase
MRITAAVVEERDGPFHLEELEVDEPGPGDVLVRIVASGVCHTDAVAVHGDVPHPLPGVLGHEGAGVVEAVGPGVEGIREGDRVVIGWPWCGSCRSCLDGQPRYCLHIGQLAFGGVRLDGTNAYHRLDGSPIAGHFFGQSSFATHSLTRANALVPVPPDTPLELLGPLACGLSTGAGAVLNVLRPGPGASLVVYGVGSVGLAAVMAARLSPATTIVAVDRLPARLRMAKELGATDVVNAAETDPVKAVQEICGGLADFSLDCTGSMVALRQAADSVGIRGVCGLIGAGPAGAEFVLEHLTTLWGKRILGILGGEGRSTVLIGALIELNRQGRFPFERLVTRFPLERINDAFEAAHAGGVLKPVLDMPA